MIDVPRIAAVSRFASARLTTPTALAAVGALLAVCAFNLWITPSNPPGFLPDEASMSYNAYLIGHHLRDENGALLPLYLKSFGDYKSPLFTYTLAIVFRVTGPHAEVARGLAAVAVLAGALLLGLFARRRTGSTFAGIVVVVLAGLTPWLFEVGRAAYEVALEPLLICLFLLAVEATWRRNAWTARRGIGVGLALTGIAFVYAAGRLLAPLFGLALLVFASRSRWRWFAGAWGTLVATAAVPIAVYWSSHPGALTERYDQTSFITSSMAPWTIAWHAIRNYVNDVNLWHWVVSGDPKPYVHTYGSGSIFGAVVLLALGSVVLVVRRRADRFWLFTVLLLVLSPIPAALTKDRYYGLRLVPLPLLLIVVALPALVWLLAHARRDWVARVACAVLVGLVAFQFVHFVDNFRARGWARTLAFHAGVPGLLREGFAAGRTIYVNQHEPHALVYARWYAVVHGIAASRVYLIPFNAIPPDGSIVFGRFQPCPFKCVKFALADDYWLGRAEGPLEEQQVPSTLPPLTLRVTTAKGSGLRVSFMAQGHVVSPGSAWGYYLRIWRHGKPWHGAVSIQVLDTKSKPVDRVGQFDFAGSTLRGYLWASADQGQVLDFTVVLLGHGNRALGQIAYRVYVKKSP